MTPPHYADDDVTIHAGDCLDVLRELDEASVDAVVTDPPYSFAFMDKHWDEHPSPRHYQAWCEHWAVECLRVLKPGGHLLAFGGARTAHRLACAIEDAGFEVRDAIEWIYGSGFPKSLDVGKAIDKAAGVEREVVGQRTDGRYAHGFSEQAKKALGTAVAAESTTGFSGVMGQITEPATDDAKRWEGWGTALKPAHEPIIVARKPFRGTLVGNVLAHGVGAVNVDGCRVAFTGAADRAESEGKNRHADLGSGARPNTVYGADTRDRNNYDASAGRWPTNVVLTHAADCEYVGPVEVATDTHYPAARGRGGISVGGHSGQAGLDERTPGREVVDRYRCAPGCPVAELDAQSGVSTAGAAGRKGSSGFVAGYTPGDYDVPYGDTGGASRFFPSFRYEPKAGNDERPTAGGIVHPTVKPVTLMRWLVRLVVPRGAVVLDPFLGSGTTAEACVAEGMKCVGIEREPTYLPIAVARISKPIGLTLDLDVG